MEMRSNMNKRSSTTLARKPQRWEDFADCKLRTSTTLFVTTPPRLWKVCNFEHACRILHTYAYHLPLSCAKLSRVHMPSVLGGVRKLSHPHRHMYLSCATLLFQSHVTCTVLFQHKNIASFTYTIKTCPCST